MNNTTKFIFDNKRWRKDCVGAMEKLHRSYENLAQNTGRSKSYIWGLIAGNIDPRMEDFIILCALLELEAINYFEENEVQMRMF